MVDARALGKKHGSASDRLCSGPFHVPHRVSRGNTPVMPRGKTVARVPW